MHEALSQKRTLSRLLQYLKGYYKPLFVAFILLLIATVSTVAGPKIAQIFIDQHLIPRHFDMRTIWWLLGLYVGFHILHVISSYYQVVLFSKVALQIIQQIRVDVFNKVQSLGLPFFDRTPAGSLVSRITNDTEAIKQLYVNVLSTFVQNITLLIGIFIGMFWLDTKIALYCIILLPVFFGLMTLYRKLSSKVFHLSRTKLSQINAKLSESIQGMHMIQAMRQQSRFRHGFSKTTDEYYKAGLKQLRLNGLLVRPAVDLIYMVTIMLVLYVFGVRSFTSFVEIGVLYAFINYLDRIFEPINMMMFRLTEFQQAIVSAERVFGLMDEQTEQLEKRQGKDSVSAESPQITDGRIEFRNVTFSYDGKHNVLHNITFTAEPGHTVALVGHTGSGKSSIINLAMRFYPVKHGEILIDGAPIETFADEELRRKLGLVLQDPFLFTGDVKHNIRLYDEHITNEEVKDAAEFVQVDPFILKLNAGYDEPIGERGATFSSGQRQLISFGRTMARHPKILVLDEATANVDTETEIAIQTALKRMRQNRTTIAIAHRLSTIQDADLILVLHRGEIVERGTHHQLLQQRGLYYNMYLLQQGNVDTVQA